MHWCDIYKQPLVYVEIVNNWLRAAWNTIFLKNRVFGVVSKLKGIVHCGVILVTLLGKASLWAGPEGSFQVLSSRSELCHPSPCCQHVPSPSGCGVELNHRPLPLPATREGTLTSQLKRTLTLTHILTLTLWHTSIFTTPPPPPPSTNAPQPMVYFPAIHSHPTPPPLLFFSSFSTLVKVARQQRKTSHTHIHPTMPLRVFRMSLFTSWSVQVVGKQT